MNKVKKTLSRRFSPKMQTKLIILFFISNTIVFGINFYMYNNVNHMVQEIDNVYDSNSEINELRESIVNIDHSIYSYLESKNTNDLVSYYESKNKVDTILRKFNQEIVDDSCLMMERDITNLMSKYFQLLETAMEFKRGRNVEKYKEVYAESTIYFSYTNSYIYSLNNQQLVLNKQVYQNRILLLDQMQSLNLVFLIIIMLFNFIVIVLFGKSITRPLQKLAEAADVISQGTLDIKELPITTSDEIGRVTKAFNEMVYSLRTYIQKVKESVVHESKMRENEILMESHLKAAELKYLQAQINPHFLFNILNAGVQLAMLEDAERTYHYTKAVANFYRYKITDNKNISTIKEEIDLIDNYMYILNVRFSGEIHYFKEVDESFGSINIPPMTLQPIFENAVKYGLDDLEREKRITLSVCQEGEEVCISVRDNGIGMDQETIDLILSRALAPTPTKREANGIGLSNVLARMHLFYEGRCTVMITSEGFDMGTDIAIYIPLE